MATYYVTFNFRQDDSERTGFVLSDGPDEIDQAAVADFIATVDKHTLRLIGTGHATVLGWTRLAEPKGTTP